jgi:hypothetical protein
MDEFRLGDVIDDYCVKCRRITNHSIVSLLNNAPAKVRCRTCYNDHDYRHEQAPPSKKDLKKQQLFKEVLGTIDPSAATPSDGEPEAVIEALEAEPEPDEPAAVEEPPQSAPAVKHTRAAKPAKAAKKVSRARKG